MRIIHFPGIYRIRVLCGWSRWHLYCKVAPVVAIDPDLTLDSKNNLIQEKSTAGTDLDPDPTYEDDRK